MTAVGVRGPGRDDGVPGLACRCSRHVRPTHRSLTLPLPQIAQRQAIRGRGENSWNADPGRREGDGGPVAPAPRLPWDILVPLQGSQDEAAASCRCTSLKIPSAGRGECSRSLHRSDSDRAALGWVGIPFPTPPESSPCPRTAVRRGTVFSSNVAPQRGMKDFLEKVDSLRCLRPSCQFLQFGIPDHSGGLRWQGAWTLVAFRCAGDGGPIVPAPVDSKT